MGKHNLDLTSSECESVPPDELQAYNVRKKRLVFQYLSQTHFCIVSIHFMSNVSIKDFVKRVGIVFPLSSFEFFKIKLQNYFFCVVKQF